MAEHRPQGHGQDEPEAGFDRELSIKKILEVGLGTAAVSLVAFVAMVFFYRALARHERGLDPPPSPIAEAQEPAHRPEPQLQERPEIDLAEVRRRERQQLESSGWVDRDRGIAQVSIERAIELTLARGLDPEPPPSPVAAPDAPLSPEPP